MPAVLQIPSASTAFTEDSKNSTSAHAASLPNNLTCALVAPRFRHDPLWSWVSQIGPLSDLDFVRHPISNLFEPLPRITKFYRQYQYFRTNRALSEVELAFLFSTDIAIGLTGSFTKYKSHPVRIYCGFTQDGPRTSKRIAKVSRALKQMDAVCTFCHEERDIYIPRYDLDPSRVHVVPIQTDETDGYDVYPDTQPCKQPYALALGSPNRRFMETAQICKAINIPLVIITRPWHQNDSLHELAALGATIITNADKMRALTYLKHARLAIMPFLDPNIAGGYTTLLHAMFLRTPFVATKALGVAEHIIHDETGFVVPHGDERTFSDAIERLWSDGDLAKRFGDAAETRAQQLHSLDAASRMYYNLAARVWNDSQSFSSNT